MSVLGEDDDEQSVEVQTLHQQPEEVGHDEVVEEHQAGLTAHLQQHALLHTCDNSTYNKTVMTMNQEDE